MICPRYKSMLRGETLDDRQRLSYGDRIRIGQTLIDVTLVR